MNATNHALMALLILFALATFGVACYGFALLFPAPLAIAFAGVLAWVLKYKA